MIQIRPQATIADLYKVREKAELIGGEVVVMSPASAGHGRTSGIIFNRLLEYEQRSGIGVAFPDNVGFLVNLPNRQSFSPDVAYYYGSYNEEEFVNGAPDFAVEVRSPEDSATVAESQLAAKRADYFAAGTAVVWDVDMVREKLIRVYRAATPNQPAVYGIGQLAEAEPILPGWTFNVADLSR